jgi:hypothetical protein
MSETLTPESLRWNEFTGALDEALTATGCGGDAPPHAHSHAKKIMAEMGNIDVEGSLEFFEARGGYCDCEILLNVDPW